MGILQLSPVSLLTSTTSFCLLQFSLHPTCLYVYPSVWWKCTFKVNPTTMNPVLNHVHMCYLHLRYPLKSWNQSLWAWGHLWPNAEFDGLTVHVTAVIYQRTGEEVWKEMLHTCGGKKIATRLQRVHIHLRFMGWIVYCALKIQNGWTGYVAVDWLKFGWAPRRLRLNVQTIIKILMVWSDSSSWEKYYSCHIYTTCRDH